MPTGTGAFLNMATLTTHGGGAMQFLTRGLLCGFLLVALPALAQPDAGTGFGTLIGTVIDALTKKPLPGAVVTATSPNLAGERTVVTDAQGSYRIPQLPPGVYALRFELETYKPYKRAEVQLRLNRIIRVNVELLPASFEGELDVTGTNVPTSDVATCPVGVNVDVEFIKSITVSRPSDKDGAPRTFESLSEQAPDAQTDSYGVSINGPVEPENGYVVDGLEVDFDKVPTVP